MYSKMSDEELKAQFLIALKEASSNSGFYSRDMLKDAAIIKKELYSRGISWLRLIRENGGIPRKGW